MNFRAADRMVIVQDQDKLLIDRVECVAQHLKDDSVRRERGGGQLFHQLRAKVRENLVHCGHQMRQELIQVVYRRIQRHPC